MVDPTYALGVLCSKGLFLASGMVRGRSGGKIVFPKAKLSLHTAGLWAIANYGKESGFQNQRLGVRTLDSMASQLVCLETVMGIP